MQTYSSYFLRCPERVNIHDTPNAKIKLIYFYCTCKIMKCRHLPWQVHIPKPCLLKLVLNYLNIWKYNEYPVKWGSTESLRLVYLSNRRPEKIYQSAQGTCILTGGIVNHVTPLAIAAFTPQSQAGMRSYTWFSGPWKNSTGKQQRWDEGTLSKPLNIFTFISR
jgi:hypothetical protein